MQFYIVVFEPGCLKSGPWCGHVVDCLIVNFQSGIQNEAIRDVAREVVCASNDWVETFGDDCEMLHDEIDRQAVIIGRQAAVGDGYPMTAWHTDLKLIDDVADHISSGGFGGCDIKVVLVLGTQRNADDLAIAIERWINTNQNDS